MESNNLLVQLGGILLTLVVTLIGIFKGLVPKLLESFEKRLSDKDTVLAQQNTALDEVCRERKELTEQFLKSLNNVVVNNATSTPRAQRLFGEKNLRYFRRNRRNCNQRYPAKKHFYVRFGGI